MDESAYIPLNEKSTFTKNYAKNCFDQAPSIKSQLLLKKETYNEKISAILKEMPQKISQKRKENPNGKYISVTMIAIDHVRSVDYYDYLVKKLKKVGFKAVITYQNKKETCYTIHSFHSSIYGYYISILDPDAPVEPCIIL